MILDAVIQEPSKAAKVSVIWLHGLGANGHDFKDLSELVNLNEPDCVRYVFPHAPSRPVTLNGGMVMPAWYDLDSLDFQTSVEDGLGIRQAQVWIEALIDREISLGVPADKIFVGGFSQGAALALHTSLRYSRRLAGCIGLSGYLPLRHHAGREAHAENRSLPIMLAHGLMDPVVPYVLAKETESCLLVAGWQPRLMSYPINHTISIEEMKDVGLWMNAQFAAN